MGIECDGATFHSSPSARERDLIRQKILEKLGWYIHRIWSTDWFSDSSKEVERLIKALNEQLAIRKANVKIEKSKETLEQKREELVLSAENALSLPLEINPLPKGNSKSTRGKVVSVNDSVSYRFMDEKSERYQSGTIIRGASNPDLGLIGSHTPLGKALIGLSKDDITEVIFPTAVREIQIIEIDKPL